MMDLLVREITVLRNSMQIKWILMKIVSFFFEMCSTVFYKLCSCVKVWEMHVMMT